MSGARATVSKGENRAISAGTGPENTRHVQVSENRNMGAAHIPSDGPTKMTVSSRFKCIFFLAERAKNDIFSMRFTEIR